jgi:catechol 2,3-dioxygenase-like lactoylglutathione lyase family enzyme
MLDVFPLVAFAATTDGARARAFYEQVLGLKVVFEDPSAVVFSANGIELRLQKVPHFNSQPHTVLGWSVTALPDIVDDLLQRGVVFERYGFLDQDHRGIWTAPSGARVAWFKDPDGNLLSLTGAPSK